MVCVPVVFALSPISGFRFSHLVLDSDWKLSRLNVLILYYRETKRMHREAKYIALLMLFFEIFLY